MEQVQQNIRNAIFRYFSFAEKTPEEILMQSVTAAVVLLVGAALFDHTPLPLVPAGILAFGWRAYHVRRTTG